MCRCCSTLHALPLQVTLIDRNERFVFKPLLYELLNGGAQAEEVAPPFRQLLAPYSITFVQAGFYPANMLPRVHTGMNFSLDRCEVPGTHCCSLYNVFCWLGFLP